MAKHHGLLEHEIADASMVPVVNIGSADACPTNLNEDVVLGVLEFRDRSVFVGDLEYFLKHE